MSITVLNLLDELQEKILLLLDPVSAIHFGLSATRIHDLLSNHINFLRILDKVKFTVKTRTNEDNQKLVEKIKSFICTTADPSPLLARLQVTIALQFPSKLRGSWKWDDAIVLERPLHHLLHVDVKGLLLLLHVREGLALRSVRLGYMQEEVGGGLLAALSRLAAQSPGRGLQLSVTTLKAVTEEDGLALAQLLDNCGVWRVGRLSLHGQVGQDAWQGLSRAAGRGKKVRDILVDKEVIKRGAREDLRKAWDSTEEWGHWVVGGEAVDRGEGEEGWRRIEMWNNGEGEEEGRI